MFGIIARKKSAIVSNVLSIDLSINQLIVSVLNDLYFSELYL